MPDVPPFSKPAWRTVHVRPKKQEAEASRPVASTSAIPVAMHAPSPGGYEPLRQGPGSWATWQRDTKKPHPIV